MSNLIGLVRQNLISRAFGTGSEIDAFNIANQFPTLIFSLIAGGALASAFIPTFTGFLEEKDNKGAWHLASAIANLVVIVLTFISLLAEVFAPQIVSFLYILRPQLEQAQQTLIVELLRIMLLTPVIFGISGLVMGILNSFQSFMLPALAPTMYWVGWIIGALFLVPSMGIYGLAWGVVLGACLHLAVQIPGLVRLAGRLSDHGVSGHALEEIAQTVRRVVDKLLHAPTVRVKELAGSPGGEEYAAALRVLFDLDPRAVEAVTRAATEQEDAL